MSGLRASPRLVRFVDARDRLMLTATVDFTDYDKRVQRTHRELGGALQRVTAAGGAAAVRYAQTNHRHKRRTGRLTGSRDLRFRFESLTDKLADGVFENTTPYARFVEYGTRAHWIHARRARVLRFYWRGSWHFRASVYHPGGRPYPFMEPAGRVAHTTMQFNALAETYDIGRTIWG